MDFFGKTLSIVSVYFYIKYSVYGELKIVDYFIPDYIVHLAPFP